MGILLTAAGCAAFLAWWFWPRDPDPQDLVGTTPENLIAAAIKACPAEKVDSLEQEFFVLAIQASNADSPSLAAKAMEQLASSKLTQLATFLCSPDETSSTSPSTAPKRDAIDALLIESKVDAALRSASNLEGVKTTDGYLRVIEFLTLGGEVDRARELAKQHLSSGDSSVELQLRLASLYGQWGEFDLAQETLTSAAGKAATIKEKLSVARQLYSMNLFSQGEELMLQLESNASHDRAEALQIAELYLEFGDLEKARKLTAPSNQGETESETLWQLRLALQGNSDQPLNSALQHWKQLDSADHQSAAVQSFREFFDLQLAATDAPAWIKTSALLDQSESTEITASVSSGRPEQAASTIATWKEKTERAAGYLLLTKLLLWQQRDQTPPM